jgi:hypothetical protein|tara:strand:- start:113 stop:517 length:405 start_codon:yes stop_codon:yes gene_type:complete
MEFKINDTFRYTSSGSLDDVIYSVRYSFEESGSSAHPSLLNYESYRYYLNCDPVTSTNLVAFASVTTSSLKDWIQDSHGESWGSFTSSIQTSMTNALNSRTSLKPSDVMTWTSGSQSLDQTELASGSAAVEIDS